VPKALTVNPAQATEIKHQRVIAQPVETTIPEEQIEKRKSKFWDRFKNNLIEIFNEDEDKPLG
jgi:hypothetical protein